MDEVEGIRMKWQWPLVSLNNVFEKNHYVTNSKITDYWLGSQRKLEINEKSCGNCNISLVGDTNRRATEKLNRHVR